MRGHEDPARWDAAAEHYGTTAHPFTALYAAAALARVAPGPSQRVLDVAAGTGALALLAARTGAEVLAVDFSPGMVARIEAAGLTNVAARVMDGQALALPDGAFDAVFSIFGVVMFPDWRRGLAEMARVTRANGHGAVATWQRGGAATFLLLREVRRRLFPGVGLAPLPEAVTVLSDPDVFARELVAAGYREPRIERVTHDYPLDVAVLAEPETLFGLSQDWADLTEAQRADSVAEMRRMAGDRPVLPVPSTALIAVARR